MPVLFDDEPNGCIKIGLINNMSDEALKATERAIYFIARIGLEQHADPFVVLTLPGVPRSDFKAGHIGCRYSNIEDLWDGHLDGLIVTGREPKAANLADEPYWDSLIRLLAWAQENTYATIFRAWRLTRRFSTWMAFAECKEIIRSLVFSSARGWRITG